MFVRKSKFDTIYAEAQALAAVAAALAEQLNETVEERDLLRAQLAERQVPAVRGQRGRFVKREG